MTLSAAVWQAVEKALSKRFEASVRLGTVQNIWPSRVFRCTLQSSHRDTPETIIVRIPRAESDTRSGTAPLGYEKSALEYLTGVDSTLAPRYLAGGTDAGFLVSEDLGAGPSLLDLLLGIDAEAATKGARAFARGLGTLHAQTAQQSRDRRMMPGLPYTLSSVSENWNQVKEAVTLLGLPSPHDAVDCDVAAIARVLAEPGDCLALSSGDPSVVNCKVIRDGIRFFDFEGACFRSAFVDAALLRFLYPTGGPTWQLPPGLPYQIESTYRTELARTRPIILEDEPYENGIAAASAAWMMLRMIRLLRVDAGPDRDSWSLLPPGWTEPIPTRSRRRQLVHIMETAIAAANRANRFPALVAWCERVTDALHSRWPEAADELPLYPAFRI